MRLRTCMLYAVTLTAAMDLGAMAIVTPAFAADTEVSKCPANKTWQNAYNKGDTSAVVALYPADAIEVSPEGIRVGPAAIKECIEQEIKAGIKQAVINATKCNIEGSTRWPAGDWNSVPTSSLWRRCFRLAYRASFASSKTFGNPTLSVIL
jgi:hypothetical protein